MSGTISKLHHCNVCKLMKDSNSFSKNKTTKNGLNYTCKNCYSEYARNYRKIIKSKDKPKLDNKQCSKCLSIKDIKNFTKNISKKYGVESRCNECEKVDRKIFYHINKEQIKNIRKEQHQKNPKPMRDRVAKFREENPNYNKDWKINNKEHISKYNKKYMENNRDKINFICAKRRAAKIKRTPKWLTENDWNKIKEFYEYARFMTETLGILFEVDHIIPLQGKYISGLHIPENLQILSEKENVIKGNRFNVNK